MMRNLFQLIIVIYLLFFSSNLFANDLSGCGWGTVVLSGEKGTLAHTSANTTNGIYSNQSVGITFDRWGCNSEDVVKVLKPKDIFFMENLDFILEDISTGRGEYLASYATLNGCSSNVREEFFKTSQENFESFSNNLTNLESFSQKSSEIYSSNPKLKMNCSNL